MQVPGSKRFRIFALLALVFIGWFAGQYYFSLQNTQDSAYHDAADQLTVATNCNVARTQCLAENGLLQLHLRLGPPVNALKPFDVEISIDAGEGHDPDSVEIEFMMDGMDMGINRYRLESSEKGRWRGRAVLPVCITGRQDWHAIVNVISSDNRSQATFSFSVH